MIRKLAINELQVGMRIIGRGLGWQIEEHTFGEDLDITSAEQIANIAGQGFTEAFVYLPDPPDTPAQSNGEQPAPPGFHPSAPLAEELPKARALHNQCTKYAQKFMTDMGNGKFSYDEAEPFVENLLHSTQRNPGALLSLAQLHQSDSYTYRHCINVSILSIAVAQYLGKPSNEIFIAGYAGLFHDLGKALIPQHVLNAQRKLNPAEFKVIQKHPTMGYNALLQVPKVQDDVLSATLEHHEKFDGSGYPAGLCGTSISRIGSIVGMADVYDALTSKRPYKDAISPSKALGIMFQMQDKAWPKGLLTEFIQMLGVYPVGSVVELANGALAIVTDTSESAVKPKVVIVRTPEGTPTHEQCNLTSYADLTITAAFTPEEKEVDVLGVMEACTQ
ncbi:HD-GYP domain-containing protein [Desulfovibrio cuneatus]|uniref:HD-GYP domain-containing protein n=1 Tax=Desulfovibrio cuneatus TaxID=159728 RepID=UPI00068422B2|nr:HD-GYP domain-containing protein [Desulfovibrio cuneatus]